MGWYRLYFLGPQGDIRNVDEFNIDSDHEALILSDSLHDAVRDIYSGYELWQNSRRIYQYANGESPHPMIPQQNISVRRQNELLKREEILHESGAAFARSRRLLERIREVREVVRSSDKRMLGNTQGPSLQPCDRVIAGVRNAGNPADKRRQRQRKRPLESGC
jgi:hypothetical protein